MACKYSVILVGIGSFGARSVGSFAKEDGVWRVCGLDFGVRPDELPADAGFFGFDFDVSDDALFKPSETQVKYAISLLADDLSRELVHPDYPMVLFCKLGGASGSFVPPLLIDTLGIPSTHVRAIVSTPFPFEGGYRNECASDALSEIQSRVSHTVHISPGKVMESTGAPMAMSDAYLAVEARLLDGVRDCLRGSPESLE